MYKFISCVKWLQFNSIPQRPAISICKYKNTGNMDVKSTDVHNLPSIIISQYHLS